MKFLVSQFLRFSYLWIQLTILETYFLAEVFLRWLHNFVVNAPGGIFSPKC